MEEAVAAEADRDVTRHDMTGSDTAEEYECKICYNYFDLDRRAPKLLSCAHTFCRECLDALHAQEGRGWRIGCPVCRHRTPLPEHRVDELPDDPALTDGLPLRRDQEPDARNPGPDVTSAPSRRGRRHACRRAAFTVATVCAVFSVLCMTVLLFTGLIFVHNFKNTMTSAGPVCFFVAGVLALISVILTWIMCLLKHRPETEISQFNSMFFLI